MPTFEVRTVMVPFAFGLGDQVKIKVSGRTGTVRSLHVDSAGTRQFAVRYVNANEAVCDDWFNSEDLEAA